MPFASDIAVQIRSRNQPDLPPTSGRIEQNTYDRKDRLRNAGRTTLIWLGIAMGSALVPFWHYFLVPGFFITAWVMGIEKMSETTRNGGGEGTCPHCHRPIRIEKSAWKLKMTDTCEGCFNELEIIPQTANQ